MLKKITNTIFVATIFFVANSLSSAQAQIYQSPVNVNSGIMTQRIMTQNNINAAMINGMIRSNMSKTSSGRSGKSSAANSAARRNAPADPLSYSHAGANSVVKPLAAQMVEKGNLQQQKEVEQIFQKFIKEYRDVANKDGFPSNDIAYAMQFFLVQNYHVYYNVFAGTKNSLIFDTSKVPDFIDMNKERTLYQQFRQMFLNNPEFSKLSDKEKQQLTETLAIMTNLVWELYGQGFDADDERIIEQAQAMAKENLENIFGTSVDNIVVNNNGISFNK